MKDQPYAEHIRRLVDAAPPLSEAQRSRLATILRPAAAPGTSPTTAAVVPLRPVPAPEPRVALYRHYDKDGVLLYLGITNDLRTRSRAHARRSAWVEFAVRTDAEWFDSRELADAAEREAIRTELPLFNGTHAPMEAKRACVDYLIKRNRLDLLQLAR